MLMAELTLIAEEDTYWKCWTKFSHGRYSKIGEH